MRHTMFVGKKSDKGKISDVREIPTNEGHAYRRRGFAFLTDDEAGREKAAAKTVNRSGMQSHDALAAKRAALRNGDDDGNTVARALLQKMKKPELVKMAEFHEVTVEGRVTKKSLIVALIAANVQADADDETDDETDDE